MWGMQRHLLPLLFLGIAAWRKWHLLHKLSFDEGADFLIYKAWHQNTAQGSLVHSLPTERFTSYSHLQVTIMSAIQMYFSDFLLPGAEPVLVLAGHHRTHPHYSWPMTTEQEF